MNNLLSTPFEWHHFNLALLAWFISFILSEKLGLSYRLKVMFGIKPTKQIKPLDCYPCFSFWFALLFSLNLYIAIIVYFVAFKIDQENGN